MTAYNELRKGAWGQLGLSRVNPKTPLWSWNDTGKNEHTLLAFTDVACNQKCGVSWTGSGGRFLLQLLH